MLTLKQRIVHILLHIFWIFPVKKNRICFYSYSATKYSCNPRYVSEFIHDKMGNNVELVWFYSSTEVKDQIPSYCKRQKRNSLLYFYSILSAGTVITNVTFPRVTPFRKKQLLINTWHGTAFKGDSNAFGNNYNLATYMIAENQLTHNVFRRKDSFNYSGKILDTGMPRNDLLINRNQTDVSQIRNSLGLTNGEHIVLYAPTFRDTKRDDYLGIDFDKVKEALTERFGGIWQVLYRYHPKQTIRVEYQSGKDVTDYPEMQELLLVSDVLITDYSSCMWDFSLMERPVFLFANDIEDYVKKERGDFYFPFRDLPFPSANNNDVLSDRIKSFNNDTFAKELLSYFDAFGRFNVNGDATEKIVSIIEKEGMRL